MKIKLKLSRKREEAVINELMKAGIEISEDAELILTEEACQEKKLYCKDGADTVIVSVQDICYADFNSHAHVERDLSIKP